MSIIYVLWILITTAFTIHCSKKIISFKMSKRSSSYLFQTPLAPIKKSRNKNKHDTQIAVSRIKREAQRQLTIKEKCELPARRYKDIKRRVRKRLASKYKTAHMAAGGYDSSDYVVIETYEHLDFTTLRAMCLSKVPELYEKVVTEMQKEEEDKTYVQITSAQLAQKYIVRQLPVPIYRIDRATVSIQFCGIGLVSKIRKNIISLAVYMPRFPTVYSLQIPNKYNDKIFDRRPKDAVQFETWIPSIYDYVSPGYYFIEMLPIHVELYDFLLQTRKLPENIIKMLYPYVY